MSRNYTLVKSREMVTILKAIMSALRETMQALTENRMALDTMNANAGKADRKFRERRQDIEEEIHRLTTQEDDLLLELAELEVVYHEQYDQLLIPSACGFGPVWFIFDGINIVGFRTPDDISDNVFPLDHWNDQPVLRLIYVPKVGDRIWITECISAFSSIASNFGGWATVVSIEEGEGHRGEPDYLIQVKQFPGQTFHWSGLRQYQADLEREYGDRQEARKCHPSIT